MADHVIQIPLLHTMSHYYTMYYWGFDTCGLTMEYTENNYGIFRGNKIPNYRVILFSKTLL